MVQSPETMRRKAREKMARHWANMSNDKKDEMHKKNALQQKACRAKWSSGKKAKERRSNTTNQCIRRERLNAMMIEEEPSLSQALKVLNHL